MTLPLFLTDRDRLGAVAAGSALRLDGPEGRHAATVRRITVGERLLVGDGAGRIVTCEVRAAAADLLDLTVLDVTDAPEPQPRLVLVQALAKGDRDEQAIEAATEIGADEVIPWQAGRCVVRWSGDRGAKAWRKWDAALVAATKQSRRARRPVLAPLASTAGLAPRVRAATAAYLLHEDAGEPLAGRVVPATGDVLVIVGPEGGIAPDEVAPVRRGRRDAGPARPHGPAVLECRAGGPGGAQRGGPLAVTARAGAAVAARVRRTRPAPSGG